MKFRMLSNEELQLLEEDLKHFLIANGLDGSRWEKLNELEPAKAIDLIGIFSDTVLQKVYEKIKFLEFRSKDNCLVFKLGPQQIDLIGVQTDDPSNDLSEPEGIHLALTTNLSSLKSFKSAKKYSLQREEEIHKMIEEGCVPSHEAFWVQLERVIE